MLKHIAIAVSLLALAPSAHAHHRADQMHGPPGVTLEASPHAIPAVASNKAGKQGRGRHRLRGTMRRH